MGEALQLVFPMLTEDLVLSWGSHLVRLGYKYDLSEIWDDLIAMLSDVAGNDRGTREVEWWSSSFRATWSLTWATGNLELRARWKDVVGCPSNILDEVPQVDLARDSFLAEWSRPLRIIEAALQASLPAGAELTSQIDELDVLLRKLPKRGYLYGDSDDQS